VFDRTYLGIANLIIHQGLVQGDVQDPDEFTLTLRVRVPPTTGFLMHYWHSPTVVIDRYMGDSCERLSPQWLKTVQTERQFWQSRTLMLEMMLYFVRNIPDNSGVSTRVRSWCSAMSVSRLITSPEQGESNTYKHSAFEDTRMVSYPSSASFRSHLITAQYAPPQAAGI
jgi:hypothetical protein